jgi:hypothetical protein
VRAWLAVLGVAALIGVIAAATWPPNAVHLVIGAGSFAVGAAFGALVPLRKP